MKVFVIVMWQTFNMSFFLTNFFFFLHFELYRKILDMHIQNASVFERSLLYKYVCETWRLIRLYSKINPHIKKFANTKNPHYSQIRSLYILVTIYIIEVTINYVISKNIRFDKIRTCMKVHIPSGVARQIARKLTCMHWPVHFFFF